jgi:hypothetical protein
MDTSIDINFKVTALQKQNIESRAFENGFDDISSYIKVAALKTQEFKRNSAEEAIGAASVSLGFKATQAQIEKIEENMQKSDCEDLTSYLLHVSQHAVMNAVIEIRSTGGLDDMLSRITKARNLKNL